MTVQIARPAAALLLGATLVTGAFAQQDPEAPNAPVPVPGQVVSDVRPLPAEHRESEGAVLLDDSRVPAQREAGAPPASDRTGVSSAISRRVSRVMERARGWDDVREAEAVPTAPSDPALR